MQCTTIIDHLETKVLDFHFHWNARYTAGISDREGVTFRTQNPVIHPDILIVGVDTNALNRLGRWPFPRRIHADLINNFARIQNQNARERALFLDIFFSEPTQNPTSDAMLARSMENNQRVFLETVLTVDPPRMQDYDLIFNRQNVLFENVGQISNVSGDWQNMFPFEGVEPPVSPYGRAVGGYGHANYIADFDEVYRRQPLVAKSAELLAIYTIEDVLSGEEIPLGEFQRLSWTDQNGEQRNISYPLSAEEAEDLLAVIEKNSPKYYLNDDQTEYTYLVRQWQDHFVPSITLSLALEYFNKTLDDVELVVGDHITIRNPEMFNPQTGSWQDYQVLREPEQYNEDGEVISDAVYEVLPELVIPVDEQASMLVNFSGPRSSPSPRGHQTFPVRSYAGYASRVTGPDPDSWPPSRAADNKIVMVGAFASGMADDEKTTPFGLMYGVEMHANALNTILMDRFLYYAPLSINMAILLLLILLMSLASSRLSTVWSLLITGTGIGILYLFVSHIFNSYQYIINFSAPAIGIFLTFISVVVYRVMTEERDKRRIKDMFGRYVSPQVVNQILENPPELGGVDKELTVFFSDIRGFTTLSESMTPQELVNHLNLYLTAMTDIILEFEGTLDKYVGDEIMCFWGAPLPQKEHALMACKCAVRQMEKLNELNSQWPPERRIDIGIGVNSGIMTVGNMGSLGRMNYTLMGDNVNLGARLEGTNKQYKTHIIISEYTYGLVKDKIIARELDNIRVKGKNKPVLIYELLEVIEE